MTRQPHVTAIIPARMGSSRFPGKPLIPILGLPMVEHVRRRVLRIKEVDAVVVATCDKEIAQVVESFGGKVIMTSPKHERATDRIEEASRKIKTDIVINVQGDEPMVSVRGIREVLAPLREKADCTCLVYPIVDPSELGNLNIVKTVLSKDKSIIYLSRSPIPGRQYNPKHVYYKQSGIMAYRKPFLRMYTGLRMTPLEVQESVDILRLIENGYRVRGVVSRAETRGVDVPLQVQEVESAIKGDPKELRIFNSIMKIKSLQPSANPL